MKKQAGTFIAGVALAAVVVGGAMALESASGPSKGTRYAGEIGSPVACIDPTCGTPVAVPTIEALPTTVTVTDLPSTGVGSTR